MLYTDGDEDARMARGGKAAGHACCGECRTLASGEGKKAIGCHACGEPAREAGHADGAMCARMAQVSPMGVGEPVAGAVRGADRHSFGFFSTRGGRSIQIWHLSHARAGVLRVSLVLANNKIV